MVVTGYDASYVYLSDPTYPDKPTNLPATIGNFKSAWTVPEGMTQNDAGPYWMLFIKRGEGKKSADDILDWNKKRSATTPNEIKALSEQCPPCGASAPTDECDIDMITVIRSEYAKFLEKNGRGEAASLYKQSAALWEGLLKSSDLNNNLKKIAELEQRALDLY
jgi:hypothetical protein